MTISPGLNGTDVHVDVVTRRQRTAFVTSLPSDIAISVAACVCQQPNQESLVCGLVRPEVAVVAVDLGGNTCEVTPLALTDTTPPGRVYIVLFSEAGLPTRVGAKDGQGRILAERLLPEDESLTPGAELTMVVYD